MLIVGLINRARSARAWCAGGGDSKQKGQAMCRMKEEIQAELQAWRALALAFLALSVILLAIAAWRTFAPVNAWPASAQVSR